MKKFFKIFFIFTLISKGISFDDLSAQPITFQKVYGLINREEIGRSVVQTNDNGFMIVAGGYNCLRTDQYGDTLWTGKVASGSWIQKTSDNNFVITSAQYPIVKFDINGNVNWLRNPYNSSAITYYISETSDKGFIISGLTGGSTTVYPYILKTDSLGYRIWEEIFSSYHYRSVIKIIQTYDNGYIFVGYDTGGYAIKLDSLGNFLWYRNYKYITSSANSIVNLNDGYLICGDDSFIKIDNFGDVIWYRTFSLGMNRETYFRSLIKTADGGFAVTGGRDTTVSVDYVPLVLLLKTDSSGNQGWYKLFGVDSSNLDYNSGRDIRQTSDSGYIITGIIDTNHFGDDNSESKNLIGGDLILIKTDKNGNLSPVFVNNNSLGISDNFKLFQNYPNPFNPHTSIGYSLNKVSSIRLKIFNILGMEIQQLINKDQAPGKYEINFDGRNLSSGIYFYQLEVKNLLTGDKIYIETKKMSLIK